MYITDQNQQSFVKFQAQPAFFDIAPLEPTLPFRRGSYDRLIAAHALSHGLIIVTDNERHFADIPGLNVENWTV